jgi:predicted outer membrane repeat protein
VSAAADGNDIFVRAGTYGPVVVSKALNFYGGYNGVTTIDGQNVGAAGFSISNTSVNIYGFTITRANDSGILSSNSSLTVTNTKFTANPGNLGGGIAVFNGGGATINNCTFTGNSASFVGGAIHATGSITGPITITNSTFVNNHAAHEGGAIYSSAASAPLIVTNCTFTNNSSANLGGAIYSQSPLTLTNSTFSGNSADQGGGALYNTGSSAITGCTFSGNVTGAYSSGGAIFNQSGTHTVSASRFWENTAVEDGGGIANSSSANLTVLTSIFAANRATGSYGSGGAIKVAQGGAGIVKIINSTFYGNTATYTGGGLFLGELAGTCSQYRVYNSILWANSAPQNKETGTTPGTGMWGCPDVYQYSDIDQNNYINYSNNIRQDPMVVNIVGGDPSAWDFHLQAGSPCIDKGSNTVPGLPAFDIDGEPRIMDGNGDTGAKADMGVDEVTGPQDTTPPAGTILINGGDPFVSYWDVSLTINVTDPSGMSQMCVSNTTSCTSWELFNTNRNWTLLAGDGEKTVYAWFRDFFGNTTAAPIIDTIIVDTAPPIDGTVTATPGTNQIVLSWSGFSDAASGINAYIVRARDDRYPSSCDDGEAELWHDSLETTLNKYANRQKYMRVCARDNLWHVSPGVTATATPEVDLTPPTGSIVINNGEAYTSQSVVILTISASDPSGVSAYCISDISPPRWGCQWMGWQTYPPSNPIGWSLSPSDGVNTVYAFFYDLWGNQNSTPYSASIIKDTVPPADGTLQAISGNNAVLLKWSGFSDNSSGINRYRLVVGPPGISPYDCSSFSLLYEGIATSYLETTLVNGQPRAYRVCAVDGAGNVSVGITASATPIQDNDGVTAAEESGPSGNNLLYDGNTDGMPDSLQTNVSSLHTFNSLNYVTLASPNGTSLGNVRVLDNPSSADTPPGVTFPYGFFEFAVNGLASGAATTVTIYLPAGANPNTYYKYGGTPENRTPHWYEFMYDGQTQTGAKIAGNVITLYFVDGLRGDDDLTANGIIVDQGGPGIKDEEHRLYLPLIMK